MQKPPFVNDEIYHIYNRGVEKRKVFSNEKDYLRFIHDLFEFNDEAAALSSNIRFACRFPSKINTSHFSSCLEVEPPNMRKPRKTLIEILIFTLMPNHFHLLVKQKKENGIVRFMQKLGTGYTLYFNQKYDRVGSLFQGRFKAVLVEERPHFDHLPFYIHFNPLELMKKNTDSVAQMTEFLEKYRWSSFPDYIGKKNFPSVTSRSFLLKIFNGNKNFKKEAKKWLELKEENSERIKDIILE